MGGQTIKYEVISTFLGEIRVVEIDGVVVSVSFLGGGSDTLNVSTPLGSMFEGKTNYGDKLISYFRNNTSSLESSNIELRGSEFSIAIWEAIRLIPFGETRTYKWVAEKIGRPGHSRAIGNELGRNPVLLGLPCHRVIRVGGRLGGYSAGVWRKRELLNLEGANFGNQLSLF